MSVIPYQINKKKILWNLVQTRTLLTNLLTPTIWSNVPVGYDHSKLIFTYYFSSHVGHNFVSDCHRTFLLMLVKFSFRCRDANLLRILGVRPQDSNPHALHLPITHYTAPIVILGRLCIQKITDPYSYGLTVCIIWNCTTNLWKVVQCIAKTA